MIVSHAVWRHRIVKYFQFLENNSGIRSTRGIVLDTLCSRFIHGIVNQPAYVSLPSFSTTSGSFSPSPLLARDATALPCKCCAISHGNFVTCKLRAQRRESRSSNLREFPEYLKIRGKAVKTRLGDDDDDDDEPSRAFARWWDFKSNYFGSERYLQPRRLPDVALSDTLSCPVDRARARARKGEKERKWTRARGETPKEGAKLPTTRAVDHGPRRYHLEVVVRVGGALLRSSQKG